MNSSSKFKNYFLVGISTNTWWQKSKSNQFKSKTLCKTVEFGQALNHLVPWFPLAPTKLKPNTGACPLGLDIAMPKPKCQP